MRILAQICNRQPSLPTAPVSNPTLVSMSSVFRCSAFGQTFKTFLSYRVFLHDKLVCFTLYDFSIHTWDECFSVICCRNGYRQKSFISLVLDSPRDTNDRRFDQNKLFVAKKASHAPTWILNGATSVCQRAVSSNSKKVPRAKSEQRMCVRCLHSKTTCDSIAIAEYTYVFDNVVIFVHSLIFVR